MKKPEPLNQLTDRMLAMPRPEVENTFRQRLVEIKQALAAELDRRRQRADVTAAGGTRH